MAPISATSPTWKVPDDITASLLGLGIVIDDGICCAALIRGLIERIEFLLVQAETRTTALTAATERAEQAEAEASTVKSIKAAGTLACVLMNEAQRENATFRTRVAALEGGLRKLIKHRDDYVAEFLPIDPDTGMHDGPVACEEYLSSLDDIIEMFPPLSATPAPSQDQGEHQP